MSTALFENLTNEELRNKLEEHGVQVGPITATTRKVYEIKLLKIVQKKDNAEEFVHNLPFSDKNNRDTTPQPSFTPPAAKGDCESDGFMPLHSDSLMVRNDAPVVQNGSSLARSVSPMLCSRSPVPNGVSAESFKKVTMRNAREKKLLLNNTSEVFVAVQESSGDVETTGSVGQINSHPMPTTEHCDSSSSDDANESVRFLSQEEVAKFRSSFSSSYNNTDELISGIASATSKASSFVFSPYSLFGKRRPPTSVIVAKPVKRGIFSSAVSAPIVGIALSCIVVFALFTIFMTNGTDFRATFKDEI